MAYSVSARAVETRPTHRTRGLLLSAAAFLAVAPVLRVPFLNFSAADAFISALALGMALSLGAVKLPKWAVSWGLVGAAGYALLALGLGASSLISGGVDRALVILAQYAFAYVVLIVVAFSCNEVELARAVRAYVWGIIVVAGGGALLYYFFPVATIREIAPYMITGSRMGSFFENPNVLAKNVSIALGPALLLWYRQELRWYEGALFLVASLAGVLVAASFGGIFTFVVALAMNGLWFLRGRHAVRFAAAVAAIVAAVVVLDIEPPAIIQSRTAEFRQTGSFEGAGSFSLKRQMMVEAIEFAMDSPIIGFGADQYAEHGQDTKVHSTYLLLLTEGGIFALLGWLFMLVAYAGGGLRSIAMWPTRLAPSARALLATLATFMFSCLTNTHTYGRYWTIPIVLLSVLTVREAARLDQDLRGV